MPNHRNKLALNMLHDHFGDLIEKVGECLIQEGILTLVEIIRKTGLGFQQVRNALIVLIQHNIVIFYDKEEKERRLKQLLKDKEDATDPDNFSTRPNVGMMSFEKEREMNERNKKWKRPNGSSSGGSLGGLLFDTEDPSAAQEVKMTQNTLETVFYYELLISELLMRLKCSKFIMLVRDRVGSNGEMVMEELLEHGRLSNEQIVNVIAQKLYLQQETPQDELALDDANPDAALFRFKRIAQNAFDAMVRNRFVKRVDKYISDESMQSGAVMKSASAIKSKTATSQKSLKETLREQQALEQQKFHEEAQKKKKNDDKNGKKDGKSKKRKNPENDLTEPANKKKRRKRNLLLDDDDDVNDDDDAEDQNSSKESSDNEEGDLFFNIPVAETELQTDVANNTHNNNNNSNGNTKNKEEVVVLWMINFDQFIRTFRNEAISKYVAERINPTAAFIFKAILSLTAPYEKTKNDQYSAIVNFDEIYRAVQSDDEYQTSQRNVEKYLDIMSQDNTRILQKMSSQMGGGSYVINLSGIVDKLKRQYAESIIEQKHGQVGCRIFRMLQMKKMLEQKQIAEFAMIPMHEARTLLYKMLQDEVVELQEVPKHADHAPSRTFYLWNVKLDLVYEKLTNNMYKTCRNLRTRLTKEQEDAVNETGGGFLTSMSNLSKEQQAFIRRLEKVEDRLEASLIHLNTLLMFFEDF